MEVRSEETRKSEWRIFFGYRCFDRLLLKDASPHRIMIAIGNEETRWHPQIAQRWVVQ